MIIPGDSTPQYNSAALVDVKHTALRNSGRDLDGKFAPLDKPVTKKQAMRKLQASSQRTSKAIDAMLAMEFW